MSVNLSRNEAFMSEKFLDASDVAPASSKCVAKLWRSVCGLARPVNSAVARCFSNSRPILLTESRPPNLLRKRGCVLAGACRLPNLFGLVAIV